MPHPEIVDVFLTSLPSQPCFSEATKCMESHSFFVNLHGLKARRQPTLLKVVVQVGGAVSGLKQQSIVAVNKCSQVLCDLL
jgi:hypothetical protein